MDTSASQQPQDTKARRARLYHEARVLVGRLFDPAMKQYAAILEMHRTTRLGADDCTGLPAALP